MTTVPKRPTFLYDADCGQCATFARLASLLGASREVDLVPIREAARTGMLDTIPGPLWFSSSRMVDPSGNMLSGGDAAVALLGHAPLGRIPSNLFSRSRIGSSAARRLYGAASRLHGTTRLPTDQGEAGFTDPTAARPPR